VPNAHSALRQKKNEDRLPGEPGANSHIACAEAYPDAEPVPCATFEDAFSMIEEGVG
jgi:prephenate dehydratase